MSTFLHVYTLKVCYSSRHHRQLWMRAARVCYPTAAARVEAATLVSGPVGRVHGPTVAAEARAEAATQVSGGQSPRLHGPTVAAEARAEAATQVSGNEDNMVDHEAIAHPYVKKALKALPLMNVDETLEVWLQPRRTTCYSASITVITDQKCILFQRRSGIQGIDLLQDFGGCFGTPLPLVLACDLARSELHMEANLFPDMEPIMSVPTLVSPEPWTPPGKAYKICNTHWCQVFCLRHRDIRQHVDDSFSYAGVPIWSREVAWKSHHAWNRFDLHSEHHPGDSIVHAGQFCCGRPVFELHQLPTCLHAWSPSFQCQLRDAFTLSAVWPMLQNPAQQTGTRTFTHTSFSGDFKDGVHFAASAWDHTMENVATAPWRSLDYAVSLQTLWNFMWRLEQACAAGTVA